MPEAAHLPEALGDLAGRWSRTSGVPVRVEVAGSPVPLPTTLEVVLFRTAQEGLANIAKHAGASRAGLTLTYTHEAVVLDILDDGAGFDPDPADEGGGEPGSAHAHDGTSGAGETARADGTGYGLTAMRRRLRQVGGTLTIESAPGDGTALSAGVPASTPLPAPAPPATEPGGPPGAGAEIPAEPAP